MGDLKPAIIFALVGFILSFLIGLISGVKFVNIILRALIIAIICGAFAFLVLNILKKYLPELFSNQETTQETDSNLGKNLDIVLDEDTESEEKKTLFPENEETQFEGAELFSRTENPELNVKSENATKKAEEFSYDLNLSSNISASESELPDGSLNIDNTENNVLDELPDMSQFEDPLADTVEEVTSDLVDTGTANLVKNVDEDFSEINVNNMARAVHTVLKKDSD
ncbi:MAG: hypothetical protein P1P64_07775 [Treponemataceae bacterium]